jgi:hypothetical protein
MGIFDNLFGQQRLTPMEKLKLETEKGFETIIQKSMRDNPDPMFGAMLAYHAVLDTGRAFKRDFIALTKTSQLTETQIDSVIDEVQDKILKKYFDNFN